MNEDGCFPLTIAYFSLSIFSFELSLYVRNPPSLTVPFERLFMPLGEHFPLSLVCLQCISPLPFLHFSTTYRFPSFPLIFFFRMAGSFVLKHFSTLFLESLFVTPFPPTSKCNPPEIDVPPSRALSAATFPPLGPYF